MVFSRVRNEEEGKEKKQSKGKGDGCRSPAIEARPAGELAVVEDRMVDRMLRPGRAGVTGQDAQPRAHWKAGRDVRVGTVMPRAPAASCSCVTDQHFAVFTCGRKATPSASMRCCIRAMLVYIRRVSTRAAVVSRMERSVMADVLRRDVAVSVEMGVTRSWGVVWRGGRDRKRGNVLNPLLKAMRASVLRHQEHLVGQGCVPGAQALAKPSAALGHMASWTSSAEAKLRWCQASE